LASETAEFLAAMMLDQAEGSGPFADSDWAAICLERQLKRDPALYFFVVLAHCETLQVKKRPELNLSGVCQWFITHCASLFRDGDRYLAPNNGASELLSLGNHSDIDEGSESEFGAEDWEECGADEASRPIDWLTLYRETLAKPWEEWLATCGAQWLEASGMQVPRSWQRIWPKISGRSEAGLGITCSISLGNEQGDSLGTLLVPAYGRANIDLRRWAEKLTRASEIEQSFAGQLQQQRLESLRQLAYGLTHEINNPLANIRTRAEQLIIDEGLAERRQRLQRIIEQAMRAHEMIADLMYFARPPEVKWSPIHPAVVARRAIRAVRERGKRLGITIHFEERLGEGSVSQRGDRPAPTDRQILMDSEQICGALIALLNNAIEAIGEMGAIAVTVRIEEARVEWLVSDNGPGMSQEARRYAFDPFYSGREAGRGLGLGLSRVYRVAKSHGGDVAIEGGPIGCKIRLWIPLSPKNRNSPASS
jgi:signal transduction histidine kinase